MTRLLLLSGVVLAVLAWNGDASAHDGGYGQPGVAVQSGVTHASAQTPGSAGHEYAQDHECGHHGGCTHFAFPTETGIQKLDPVMVQKPVSVTGHRSNALVPLDHPPKLGIAI